jgi:Tol biopolymer transport system component
LINRREFIQTTTAGLAVWLTGPNVWAGQYKATAWQNYDFKPYRKGDFAAPVTKVTPDGGFYLHTFYDVCPWSPSGRYLVVTKLPYQRKKPVWGDAAEICVIDLQEQAIRTVYSTKGWSFQLGANVQWGNTSDRYLYTNDVINEIPVCVRLDLETGKVKAYAGAKYDLAPDEKSVISPELRNMNIHQYGYAVPDPPSGSPIPFTKDEMNSEGLWKTDLTTNKRKLLRPLQDFFNAAEDGDVYEDGIGYLFHSKYNPQNTRIMQVFRAQINGKGRNASLFTMDMDGKNLKQCLSQEHWNHKARLGGSGNHPNWHPDGERIIMNCIPAWLGLNDMLFCSFRYDGSDFKVLSEKHLGSGHPSVEPTSTYLLSDAYPKQTYVVGENGEIPIRLLNLNNDSELQLCTIPTDVGGGKNQYLPEDRATGGSQHKLDPHPAWSRNYSEICFNGAPEMVRQVFVANLKEVL